MNELERQIRELSLRQPGDSMDERIFSLLQASGHSAPRDHHHAEPLQVQGEHAPSGMMESRTSQTALATEKPQSRRGIFLATFAGLSTALLIGIAVGNAMPSLWSDSRRVTTGNTSSANDDKAIVSEHLAGSELPMRHPMMPDVPAHVRDALKIQPTVGSQFVESSYQSAITSAVLWEQQNGEVFNVATHVSDRRFDMCRDCHRVGG